MNKTMIDGQLEINHERGIIYFHATDKAFISKHRVLTVLKISGAPTPIPQIHDLMLEYRITDELER